MQLKIADDQADTGGGMFIFPKNGATRIFYDHPFDR
jgi:hypothetical protein